MSLTPNTLFYMQQHMPHTPKTMIQLMGWDKYPSYRMTKLVFDIAMSINNMEVLIQQSASIPKPPDFKSLPKAEQGNIFQERELMLRWDYRDNFRDVVNGGPKEFTRNHILYVYILGAVWTIGYDVAKEFLENGSDYDRGSRRLLDRLVAKENTGRYIGAYPGLQGPSPFNYYTISPTNNG